MKLLAKRPERRPQNAAEFCSALEALAKAGKLGSQAAPSLDDQAAAKMLDLARALSTTPVSSDLVRIDGAPVTPPAAATPAPAQPLAPSAEAPRVPVSPAVPEDLATTMRDFPAFTSSDESRRSAERSEEVAGLRAALGLRIEQPAFEVNDPFQVSALVVNLERGESDADPPGPRARRQGRAAR